MKPEPTIITRGAAYQQHQRFFYTGKPCRRGHTAQRYVSTGTCIMCMNSFKRENRKHPTDRNAVPYTPSNVWRPASWTFAQMEELDLAVQRLIDSTVMPTVAVPIDPKVRTIYGVSHRTESSYIADDGIVHPLWVPLDGRAREQRQLAIGGSLYDIYCNDALNALPIIFEPKEKIWYVAMDSELNHLSPLVQSGVAVYAALAFAGEQW